MKEGEGEGGRESERERDCEFWAYAIINGNIGPAKRLVVIKHRLLIKMKQIVMDLARGILNLLTLVLSSYFYLLHPCTIQQNIPWPGQ